MLAAVLMMPFRYGSPSNYEIEKEARRLGMIFPADVKAVEQDTTSKGAVDTTQ